MVDDAPPKKPSLIERAKAAPLTWAITAVNIAYFAFCESEGGTTNTANLLRFGAVEPVHVWAGEPWRVASYMFLHIGWMHLLWNTWASFSMCTSVERVFGSRRFLFIYLTAGIGGGCACALFSNGVTAGASGAMFGIVGAILAVRHRQLGSFKAFTTDPGVRSTMLNIVIWTVIGSTVLNVSNQAHFGGFVVGILATMVLLHRKTAYSAAFGVAMMAFFFACFRPGWHPTGEAAERVTVFAEGYLQHDKRLPDNQARGERMAKKGCEAGIADLCGDRQLQIQF